MLSRLTAAGAPVLGVVLIFFAVAKAMDPKPTVVALRYLLPIDANTAFVGAGLLVSLESALGLFLLLGIARRRVAMLTIAVLVVFSAAIVWMLARPDAPSCGCQSLFRFAQSNRVENSVSLARNALLLGVAWLVLRHTPSAETVSPPSPADATALGGTTPPPPSPAPQ